jgi:N,N'-diacetyllegionaminate synthase
MNLFNLEKTFIIAEIGINHDGSLEKLKKMISVAKNCGVDAVKLQVMTGYDLVAGNIEYRFGNGEKKFKEDLAELFYSRRVKEEWLEEIYNYSKNIGIICFATPFSERTVDLLEKVDNPIYKISSGDITHIPLIKYIAKIKKPMILSSGKSTLSDVDEAVRAIRGLGNENFALLHCISSYPTPYENLNLRVMNTLETAFQTTVGFSDHSEGFISSVAAVCMGAKIIEKHFTLDKNDYGPDHWFSLDPNELKLLVDNIRLVEKTFGNPIKDIPEIEKSVYYRASRSIVASKKIQSGEIFTLDNLTFKRPGVGLKPKYIDIIIGKKARNDIDIDNPITWDDF